jgi:hypothetical protein
MVAGCSLLSAREQTRLLQLAVQDDQTCRQQGWKYPEPRYVSCRLKLDDDRDYHDWMSLQLTHQTQNQPYTVPAPYDSRDTYRRLDPDHYDCRYTTVDGHDYVLCAEDVTPQKP